MKSRVLLFSLTLTSPLFAQLVAFTGRDTNPDETLAFVALQDIPNNTVIFFTGDDYSDATNAFLSENEGNIMFTVSGTLSTGTVVQIQETSNNTFTVTGNPGTASFVNPGGGSWSLGSGDPLYAFSSSNNAAPAANLVEIYAMLWPTNSPVADRNPSNDFPNAIVVDSASFTQANPAVDFTGSRCATHASLADSSNFTEGDNVMDLTAFTCVPVELSSVSVE